MMPLSNAVISFLAISIIFELAEGNSTLEGVQNNCTTGSQTSPLLKKALNHGPRPRPPGCRSMPWTCKGLLPPPARMRCCKNQCVDVSYDVNNCGFCGIRCPFTWQCCRGFCVDTNHSPFNCGRCRNRCPWKVRCVYGMCGYAQPFPTDPFPPKPLKPWPPHPPDHPG